MEWFVTGDIGKLAALFAGIWLVIKRPEVVGHFLPAVATAFCESQLKLAQARAALKAYRAGRADPDGPDEPDDPAGVL